MDRVVDRALLACDARTHAIFDHDRFLRIRCTDRHCPARKRIRGDPKMRIYHVWDLGEPLPGGQYRGWTEYEPAPSRPHE